MAATAKATSIPAPADYGLDAPGTVRNMFQRGAMLLLLDAGMWYMNREYNPTGGAAMLRVLGSIGVTLIAGAAVMVWSSRSGKMAVRDKISIP